MLLKIITDCKKGAEIRPAYEAAKAKGMYTGQYAINTLQNTGPKEHNGGSGPTMNFMMVKHVIQSPDDLKAYAPTLYHILERVYAGHHIPADVYHGKNIRPARRR